MTSNTNQNKKILLVSVLSAMVLFGCGRKDDKNSSASVINPYNTSTLASCNMSSTANTQMNIATFVDNGQVRNDIVRVKFSKINSQFLSNGGKLQFFRWRAFSSGQTYMDSTALTFQVLDTSTNSIVLTSNRLFASDVSSYSSSQDMNRYVLVVDIKDYNAEYDVLRSVIYTSAGAVSEYIDTLIPSFSANPAEYATKYDGSVRAPVLQGLHPFKTQINSGINTAQFVSQANAFCF